MCAAFSIDKCVTSKTYNNNLFQTSNFTCTEINVNKLKLVFAFFLKQFFIFFLSGNANTTKYQWLLTWDRLLAFLFCVSCATLPCNIMLCHRLFFLLLLLLFFFSFFFFEVPLTNHIMQIHSPTSWVPWHLRENISWVFRHYECMNTGLISWVSYSFTTIISFKHPLSARLASQHPRSNSLNWLKL